MFKKKGTGNPVLINKKEGKYIGRIAPFNTKFNIWLVGKYDRGVEKKAPIPAKDEKPIHGLVSDKNFIVANAVENILAGKCITSRETFLNLG